MQAIEPLRRSIAPDPVQHEISLVPEGHEPSPIRWLIQLLRRHSPVIGSVLIYAVGVGLLALVTPVAVQALVSNVAFGTLLQPLVVLSLLLLGGLALRGVLKVLQAWIVEALQRRLFVDFVELMAARLPRMDADVLRWRHGPELANRFFDVYTLQKTTASLLIGGLDAVLTAVVGMGVLAFYHPLLLAFDILLVLALVCWVWLLGKGGVDSAIEESRAKYAVADALEQTLGQPISARSRPGRGTVERLIDGCAANYLRARSRHFHVVLRQLIGAVVLQALASAALLGIGGFLVISRQLSLGQLVAAELIVTGVVATFATLGKHAEIFYDMLAALDKLGSLASHPVEDPSGESLRPTQQAAQCELFGLVLFGGAGGERRLEVQVPAGARVRLVGGTDAEREQLLRSLYGMARPADGHVRLDGMDMRDLSLDTLRERVALVLGPEIWSGTVHENLRLEAPEADLRSVSAALEAMGLERDISALPDALATQLTPSGGPLSLGQSLRLTLARAVLRRPQLLLVGNAIDALSPEHRREIVHALVEPGRPWTLIVASYDEVLDAMCSHVLDLDSGSLREVAK